MCWYISQIVAYSCYDDFDNDDDLITWYKSKTRNNVKSEKKNGKREMGMVEWCVPEDEETKFKENILRKR